MNRCALWGRDPRRGRRGQAHLSLRKEALQVQLLQREREWERCAGEEHWPVKHWPVKGVRGEAGRQGQRTRARKELEPRQGQMGCQLCSAFLFCQSVALVMS